MQATIEYREATDANTSRYTVLAQKVSKGREYKLVHRTAGYEPAGSAMRYINENWAVDFWLDNARHGKRFKTLAEAEELYHRKGRS